MVYGGMRKGRLMDRVRVIRVLEYVGPRTWVEGVLEKRGVKGVLHCENCTIREAILGDFPEIVEGDKESPYKRPYIDKGEWHFMEKFGWGMHEEPAVKRDHQTGKVLAHEGDETWTRDLKVAGE